MATRRCPAQTSYGQLLTDSSADLLRKVNSTLLLHSPNLDVGFRIVVHEVVSGVAVDELGLFVDSERAFASSVHRQEPGLQSNACQLHTPVQKTAETDTTVLGTKVDNSTSSVHLKSTKSLVCRHFFFLWLCTRDSRCRHETRVEIPPYPSIFTWPTIVWPVAQWVAQWGHLRRPGEAFCCTLVSPAKNPAVPLLYML